MRYQEKALKERLDAYRQACDLITEEQLKELAEHPEQYQNQSLLVWNIFNHKYIFLADYYHTIHWEEVSYLKKARAEFTCENCGSKESIQCHHKNYTRIWHEQLNDLEVLCHKCHKCEDLAKHDRKKSIPDLELEFIENSSEDYSEYYSSSFQSQRPFDKSIAEET